MMNPDATPSPQNSRAPEWTPATGGEGFATRIMPGLDSAQNSSGATSAVFFNQPKRRSQLSADDYVQGVLNGNRAVLARAITLIESNAESHLTIGQEVIRQLLPHTGKSIRIGITGVPGAGKSTFIETLGSYLCEQKHRVAVLAIDPSSTITKGSILGDKTRMEKLVKQANAFIRPSPSGGIFGGVARKSRETTLLCEAAGFDIILIETIGVGQSEVAVRSMVDFYLLLMLTGAGDELQSMKKGTVELADAIIIHKADGENKLRAQAMRAEFNRVLHLLAPVTDGWVSRAYTCSSLTGEGLADIWRIIESFWDATTASGTLMKRRQQQLKDWVLALVEEQLRTRFYKHPAIQHTLPMILNAVSLGETSAVMAAQQLLTCFDNFQVSGD